MIIEDHRPRVGSSTFYEAIVEGATDPLAVIDDQLNLAYASQSIRGLLGWQPADWVGRCVAELLEPESLELTRKGIGEWKRSSHDPDQSEAPIRIFLRTRWGTSIPVDATVRDAPRAGIDGFVVQLHPAAGNQALSDAVDMILAGVDPDRVLWQLASLIEHDITRSVAALGTGWDGNRFDTIAGDDSLVDLAAPCTESRDALRFAFRSGHPVSDLWDHLAPSTRSRASDVGLRSCWCVPMTYDHSTAALLVWHTAPGPPGAVYSAGLQRATNLIRLAVQWSAQQHRLAWDVAHDQLTGLLNRSEFQNRLDGSSGNPRVVLFCDLDDFKPINERFGHRAGDQVLAAVAGRLRGLCDPCAMARLGGDEFAMLMEPPADIDDALQLAQRVRDVLARPIAVAGHRVAIGVTIGIAFDAVGAAHSDLLLDEADRLLRRGKSQGKNQVLSTVLAGPAD